MSDANTDTSPRAETALIVGSSRNPLEVTKRLREVLSQAHLVSPFTQCPNLPEGVEIAFTAVQVNTDKDAHQIYPVGDNRYALSKVVLDQISVAAGITWLPGERHDDRRNPRYCSRTETGWLRLPDGQLIEKSGTSQIDLTPGGDLCTEIIELKKEKFLAAALGRKRKQQGRDVELTLPEQQKVIADAEAAAAREIRRKAIKIEELTQSGARCRAIRSLGVNSTYSLAELEKPFVVVKPVLTGRSSNPMIAARMADRIADSFLESRSAAYGRQRAEPLPVPHHERALSGQTHVGYLGSGHEDDAIEAEYVEPDYVAEYERSQSQTQPQTQTPSQSGPTEPSQSESSTAPAEERQAKTAAAPADDRAPFMRDAAEEEGSDFLVPFGKYKGESIRNCPEDGLSWLVDALQHSIENPDKAKYVESNRAQKSIVMAEIERRRSTKEANKPAADKVW
jgi:hypothetical protein